MIILQNTNHETGMKLPLKHRLYRRYIGFRYYGNRLVTLQNGMEMFICPSASSVEKNLIKNRIYEKKDTAIVMKIIKKGMTVVDIGAHVGYYTLLFSKLVGKEGMVYAFEPNPITAAYLRTNIALNKITNVEVFEVALSDEQGTFHYRMNTNNMAWAFNDDHSFGVPIATKKGRLDDFLQNRKIDFIKIDIDGNENECIKGAEDLIRNNPDMTILMEITNMNDTYIPNFMKSCGFVMEEIEKNYRNVLWKRR